MESRISLSNGKNYIAVYPKFADKFKCTLLVDKIIGNRIDVCGYERVVGGILSFNTNDESDNVYDAIEVLSNPVLIPFAIDPSGDYFCFDTKNNEVLFWNHEVNKYQEMKLTINEFRDELYE